jgi:hypothetical protein
MPLVGAGLAFCAKAGSASRQEKAPVNKISPHVGLLKNVLIMRLRNGKILGREKKGYWPEALTATLPSLTPT